MQNVAQELSATIGELRSRKDDGGLSALAVVVAVFLVSATAVAVFNHEGNAGAKVAEAASRVDRQGDDTQAVCTDIRELILEQKNLAAVSPESYANESTSGNNSEFKYASPNDSSNDSPNDSSNDSPNDSSNVAMPKNGGANDAVDNVSNERRNSIYGINPAKGGASNAPESADEKDDQDAVGDADQIVPPTLTFNDRAREIQGDRALTQRQEAMDRIVSNWTPRYVAARRKYQELVERINDTRQLWPEYRKEQITLIERQGNAKLRDSMHRSLVDDTKSDDRWRRQASDVERRSAPALSKIEDLNTFILFDKNQSAFKAITEYDDLDVPLQVGLLLESLDAFEPETDGRAEAMKSS